MIVYPSIDIRDGRCVRLVEGDFARETVFDDDPVRVAERFAATGATWVHVVDLDGSVCREPVHLGIVATIASRLPSGMQLQLGGGLRSMEHLDAAFAAGVSRCVLGSVALDDPDLVAAAARRWPGRIAVGLDTRNGRVATNGWLDQSDVVAVDLARRMLDVGVATFIFTDIARDGTLAGPNLEALSEMIAGVATPESAAEVIASGGVASLDDIRAIAGSGASGVIIGRALYDCRIDLAAALSVAASLAEQPEAVR